MTKKLCIIWLVDFEPSRSDVRRTGLKACKPNSAKAQAKSGWPLRGGPLLADFVVAPHSHCLSSAHSSRLELGSGLGLQMLRNFFVATLKHKANGRRQKADRRGKTKIKFVVPSTVYRLPSPIFNCLNTRYNVRRPKTPMTKVNAIPMSAPAFEKSRIRFLRR